MIVFGLTGGIGSGKSAVATLLQNAGMPVVGADDLARDVVAPGTPGLAAICNLLGNDILDSKGQLDRASVARQVFSDPNKRKQLEEIIHPRVRSAFQSRKQELARLGHQVLVYEIPLLYETNSQDDFDGVIVITAPIRQRIERIKKRDQLEEQEINRRMGAQVSDAEKRKRANYVIENDGSMEALASKVQDLIQSYLLAKLAPAPCSPK